MKSLLDRSFEYVPAAKTNLKKTFARIRREQRAKEAQDNANAREAFEKVQQLYKTAAAK